MTAAAELEYLKRRHRQALANAEAARDPSIARIHLEFAHHYAQALEKNRRSQPG